MPSLFQVLFVTRYGCWRKNDETPRSTDDMKNGRVTDIEKKDEEPVRNRQTNFYRLAYRPSRCDKRVGLLLDHGPSCRKKIAE